ncbi:sugar phosphate isomerase/epimerase [Bacillus sp. B15-48]|uniref:sugar phosphate isomerase/epimerase family protein n=1 Tax=Bacillus sp. B15-48 TaxID=1548601 RepID=UPI001940041A|nr:sugar phosphate isomerase/epimerase [Bacillus sp. B15-48]MBM4763362.1 TIM barrel protein [Bacillus sp. B15-48]
MTRQFSISYLTTLNVPPPEMIHIAARAGYDFVGLRTIAPADPKFSVSDPGYPLSKDKAMLRATKNALQDTGLKLLDLEVVVIYDGLNPTDYLNDFEAAAELGGRHVVTVVKSEDRNYAIECFAELCDLAKPFGLTMDLEYVTWFKVSTLKDALEIVEAAGCDNGGILVDPLHHHRSRVDNAELDQLLQKWINYAQLCDGPSHIPSTVEELVYTGTKERLYVGEGGIDVEGIVKRLPEVPYAIEMPHVKRIEELGAEEFARRCLQTAKDYLDQKLGVTK